MNGLDFRSDRGHKTQKSMETGWHVREGCTSQPASCQECFRGWLVIDNDLVIHTLVLTTKSSGIFSYLSAKQGVIMIN